MLRPPWPFQTDLLHPDIDHFIEASVRTFDRRSRVLRGRAPRGALIPHPDSVKVRSPRSSPAPDL